MKNQLQKIGMGLLAGMLAACSTTTPQKSEEASTPSVSYESVGDPSVFKGEEWYDAIETVQVNRELAHSTFIPYDRTEQALANEQSALTKDVFGSSYVESLNGTWSFAFAENPFQRLSDTWYEEWDTTDWDTVEVPYESQLIRNEDGSFKYDSPIYINQIYPWTNYEPIVLGEWVTAPTTVNGVSHVKRTFTIPEDWDEREIFVQFEGVSSAFYLFVNGNRIGYAEDSTNTDEFDLTPYLNRNEQGGISGVENTIALQIYRWSTGSYLENQDTIRLSGIFRDVKLVSKGSTEIRDFFLTSSLHENYQNATLQGTADLRNLQVSESVDQTLEVELYEANQTEPILTTSVDATLDPCEADLGARIQVTGTRVDFQLDVNSVHLWTMDDPYLYRVILRLKNAQGETVETICQRFGFREIAVQTIDGTTDTQMILNGMPLLIKGVNRLEYCLESGNVLSNDQIYEDLCLMKQNHFNAFRTSHYPDSPITYDFADELGLLVCDEANIESHYGAVENEIPSGYVGWNSVVMDRTQNLVERDKNHSSVCIWSLGNESTYEKEGKTLDELYPLDGDYCFQRSSAWILERDPSRLRKYERDNRYTQGDRKSSIVDIDSSQYYSLEEIQDYLDSSATLPYIQSEYAHSMGNGLGNLYEYWELFRNEPQAQGGFIWDFKDQSILQSTSGIPETAESYSNLDSSAYFSYGGDWGDTINDLDFCGDGLLYADGSMSSKMLEAKHVLQDINVSQQDAHTFTVTNEFYSTSVSDFAVSYAITVNGKVVEQGKLDLNAGPQESQTFTVDYDEERLADTRATILFKVQATEDTNYGVLAGDEIASEQFILSEGKSLIQEESETDLTNVQVEDSTITVTGKDFEVILDSKKGVITSWIRKGNEVMTSYPALNFDRAPISNDMHYSFIQNEESNYATEYENAASQFEVDTSKIEITQTDQMVTIVMPGELKNANAKDTITVQIRGEGTVTLTNTFETPSKLSGVIPKIGMEYKLDSQYETVQYYGRGPEANYSDRKSGSFLGFYETTVTDLFEGKYLHPQENGNRTDTVLVSFLNDEQAGLVVLGDGFEFSALHYTWQDLASASHAYELTKQSDVIVNLNTIQRGLGNAICGPLPLSQYTIQPGTTYTSTVQFVPVDANTNVIEYLQN